MVEAQCHSTQSVVSRNVPLEHDGVFNLHPVHRRPDFRVSSAFVPLVWPLMNLSLEVRVVDCCVWYLVIVSSERPGSSQYVYF